MIRLALSGLVAATLACTTPVFAEDVTISTALGEVSLPANPAKVAVLDVAAIDTLTSLGVTPVAVPDKLYVDYLDAVVGDATRVGTLFEPNLEVLAGISPDLIIAGGRSASQVAALSQVATTIDMTIGPDLVTLARGRIETYGKLFGKGDEAAGLTAKFDAKLAEAQAAVAGKGSALILQTNGPKISAFGKGSRFGWLHNALGLPEARENLNPEVHGDAISFEFIAEVNPDWLIVVDRAAAVGEQASATATLDNALVRATTAGQNNHIIYLNPTPLYIAGGGYRSIMGTMDEMITAFTK